MMATRHSLNLCSSSILIVIAILIFNRLPLRAGAAGAARGLRGDLRRHALHGGARALRDRVLRLPALHEHLRCA